MKKVENFRRALKNLKEIETRQPPYDTITQTGMVSRFEICFEQAWKAMKEQLEISGYSEHKVGSPRVIIKQAYQAEMIQDESLWLRALTARNNVAHSYNEAIALGIIKDSKANFIAMFEALETELLANWVVMKE